MNQSTILQRLQDRYATDLFTRVPIPTKDLSILQEAVRLAPSSMNLQPWRIVEVTSPALREQLWQEGYQQEAIKQAPHLFVLTSRNDLNQIDVDTLIQHTADVQGVSLKSLKGYRSMIESFISNKSLAEIQAWTKAQSYIALGFLLQTAALLKIDAAPMEGFDAQKVNEILELTDYTAVTLIALGYRSNQDMDQYRPKVRYPLKQIWQKK